MINKETPRISGGRKRRRTFAVYIGFKWQGRGHGLFPAWVQSISMRLKSSDIDSSLIGGRTGDAILDRGRHWGPLRVGSENVLKVNCHLLLRSYRKTDGRVP